ncbi:UDP-N-acetylmuramoyl-L-alanine--D-glutamate ligase [Algoriphagus hitonicola]|uniref:UDP-N-acetylmuramoylalanine--D-glutamate ligase n=1 Tax=Algoriphagus hitonicola TaxID=435880 RepID=A0A1I2UTB5_9BACT|nr:UDP-N-acetylmuramoyl-L-alanine--D-glutamate ligase [Algoriphagus hitonicola]SFG79027.1 UDP-N-acetylmuramoylalanine--D-glutamate ligase [Algoriphagus hitonicola]
MKTIAIIGAGESGLGAAMLAKRKGYGLFVSEMGTISADRKSLLEENAIPYEEGGHSEEKILDADMIIKSPGIPTQASVISKALDKGIAVVDELEFAHHFSNGKTIAITGTNGKTTTTLLIYHLLKSAGIDVGLAGNVGKSWAGQLIHEDHAWWVIECSSFQIDGMQAFRPDVAILTNITPDHLDRYEYQFDNYIASKFRLFQAQKQKDFSIFYDQDEGSKKGIGRQKIRSKKLWISLEHEVENGAFVQDGEFVIRLQDEEVRIPISSLSIKGKHNRLNALFAITAARIAGASREQILDGIQSFENAPHRMEFVGMVDGVRFTNDSKGTNVEATTYALESYDEPIVWIAGGVDKGNDYTALKELVKNRVLALICLGKENQKLKQAFENIIPEISETQDIREAVRKGLELSAGKGVVLLSPACASFDLFKNYEDRGNQFREAVKKLKIELNA